MATYLAMAVQQVNDIGRLIQVQGSRNPIVCYNITSKNEFMPRVA